MHVTQESDNRRCGDWSEREANSVYIDIVVSRLGLEPRALALKGLIKLLRLGETESDGVRESPYQDE